MIAFKGGNLMAKNLKKDLMAVNKAIKALSKKIEKMIVVADTLESAKAVKKAKTKTVKKAPAKEKTIKAKPAATKKALQATAADTVFGFIKRSKKGINTGALVVKTGFNQKKIANIIYKLKKQGNIKSFGKGDCFSAGRSQGTEAVPLGSCSALQLMDLICDEKIKKTVHVFFDVLRNRKPPHPGIISLPQRTVAGKAEPLSFLKIIKINRESVTIQYYITAVSACISGMHLGIVDSRNPRIG